jgi:hypothetical protein
MVEVSVTASVKAAGGPTVPLGTTLHPESYTYASVDLDADATTEVDLLPVAGTVVLLALAAKKRSGPAGLAAVVTVTPVNGANSGAPMTVDGQLLITNAGVLAALVDDSPRALKLKAGADPVTVDIFTCLDLP